ncbi:MULTISPECIES: hypothetical protein [Sphingobacterium]|uniref:FUSC family protein n=1 Tax=Sphingobacterium litopenaei TaxID=2763500 RepID=A0ABR7Y9I5_9SPHI|nr:MULTISPECIES: hypothetical protein [Sphingobacterium]MBD1427964.1 hypothetical protein [Sphingobacterium litopenaei]NGM74404.1 hypothetical protein [Sphingobacterium sp. SGL-16]
MELTSLFEQSTQELNKKLKQLKTEKIINAVLVGFTIGVFAFSAFKGGLGFGSILTLLVAYFFIRNANKSNTLAKEIEKELELRNAK